MTNEYSDYSIIVHTPKHIDLLNYGKVVATLRHITHPWTHRNFVDVLWFDPKGSNTQTINTDKPDVLNHILYGEDWGNTPKLFALLLTLVNKHMSHPEPAPKDEGADVTDSLIAKLRADGCDAAADLIEQRRIYGLSKYGQTLKTGDGRDTKTDLSDEIGDGLQYAHKGRLDGSLTEGEADAIHEHLLAAYSVLRGCYD